MQSLRRCAVMMIKADGRRKTKVVLVQLGSPASPKTSDVRKFLKDFLGDPRVVDLPPLLWKVILYLFVLPFRPARSARLYARIWDGSSFPLLTITRDFTHKVQANLNPKLIEVDHAFLLSPPKVSDVWDSWENDIKTSNAPATSLLVIPMFPQYSESTIASGADGFFSVLKNRVQLPPFEFMTNFHRAKCFVDNSVRQIEDFLLHFEKESRPADALLISFHGIPKRRVLQKNDAYYQHCFETFHLITRRVKGMTQKNMRMSFQSRFGSEEWLTPYTEEVVDDLIGQGKKKIAVYCPSFVADCLETIDEIGTELNEQAHEQGGEILFIPCLNDQDQWCRDFAQFVENHIEADAATKQEDYYTLDDEDYKHMSTPEFKESEPLAPESKSTIKIIFLTLFLDLVGFSIIFPLFPALAKHYLAVDGDNFFLRLIFDGVQMLMASSEGAGAFSAVVLFGGALGAIYSFLQFLAAPLWGALSDRIGRRPVLLISVSGLALSYLLWFFSGSFTLLIIARFVGGIMGGNISTATAVIADVTSQKNRSKGMAFVGIAFALGFIIGPALGGVFALLDLTQLYPALKSYGVNPFSMAALVAFGLSAINLVWIAKKYKETLPEKKKGEVQTTRSNNPFKLFKPLPFAGVNKTNFGNFLFITAFSGMEFTLTFLAVERLSYSPMDNAYMFIFIGLMIALVQGGVVRRKASDIGEKNMALMGLVLLIPGLLLISMAYSSWPLYAGLFFLSVGSAMIVPCLTALVSLYTPSQQQGQSLGVFRSLGALGRVFGPILASMIYWRYGSSTPYLLGSAFLLIPILLVASLPRPKEKQEA